MQRKLRKKKDTNYDKSANFSSDKKQEKNN